MDFINPSLQSHFLVYVLSTELAAHLSQPNIPSDEQVSQLG
jgi:hypothetical protein